MSEEKSTFFEATFNGAVKFRSRDQRLSSDGGVLLFREADQRLGLVESLSDRLRDPRDQDSVRYTLPELLRARIYAQALGYNADDDLDRLAQDPAFKIAVWNRSGDRVVEERLASQPTQSRLLDILANNKSNLEALRAALPDWLERHLRATGGDRAVQCATLDIDSFPIQVHGSQPGGRYNGYYEERIYHPLVAGFAPYGDYDDSRLGDGFAHAMLRGGNVASAQGAIRFIRQAIRRCCSFARNLDVRFDAGFTHGNIMDALTDDGTRFLGRLKSNKVVDRMAQPYLNRPIGRPPKEGYERVVELGRYQAGDWRYAQRLILVIVDKPDPKTGQLELLPHYFFLVTNWSESERHGRVLLDHYRQRGTFEDRIGELQNAIAPRLSSPRFEENEASFLLSLLSFNLASMIRGDMESATGNGWDLSRVQKTVLKAGAHIAKGARRLYVDIAIAVTPLWDFILGALRRWRLPSRYDEPRGPQKRDWVPPPAHAHLDLVLRQ